MNWDPSKCLASQVKLECFKSNLFEHLVNKPFLQEIVKIHTHAKEEFNCLTKLGILFSKFTVTQNHKYGSPIEALTHCSVIMLTLMAPTKFEFLNVIIFSIIPKSLLSDTKQYGNISTTSAKETKPQIHNL